MLLLAGFVMSFLGLVVFKRVAPKLGLLDRPNLRSHHGQATVVGGGFVVALVFIALILVADDTGQLMLSGVGGLAWTMLALALVGLADDRFDLPALPRLMAYCLACGFLISIQLVHYPWPLLLVWLICGVWTINVINFMDGLDGFATTQVLVVCVGLGLFAFWLADDGVLPSTTVLCVLLVVSLLPFWLVNWPPASIFMGDSGAVFLGFTLCVIGVVGFNDNSLLGFAWLILMAPFLVDAGVTLLIRLWQGHPPHIAHNDHLYQRLARRTGCATTMNTGLLMLHGLWQMPSLIGLMYRPNWAFFMVFLSVIPTLLLLVRARRWR